MRYKLRKDNQHAQIVAELLQSGFAVADTYQAGAGFPDLVISRNGLNVLCEIKTQTGLKTALDRLRPSQVLFQARWKGPIITAFSASEIVHSFNMLLKRNGWQK